jgi:hypothetical protein
MHATLAYLNVAGTRATRLTRSNSAFIRVLNTLLANTQSVSRRKPKSPRPVRKPSKAG